MQVKGIAVVVSATLVAGIFVLILVQQPAIQPSSQQVAVTWGLLAEIVYRLTDGEITIYQILPPGVEIHEWEPTPDVVNEVARSNVLLWTVEQLDGWARSLAEKTKIRAFKVTEGVELLPAGDHHNYDPHVWLSIKNTGKIVQNVARILEETFPVKADKIQRNTAKLLALLEQLAQENSRRLEPYRGKLFVTQHNAFRYFAESYELSYVAILTGEQDEPSAARLAEIYHSIKMNGVKVVYAEDDYIHPILRNISNDLGISISMLYTGETLTLDEVRKGRSFIELMKLNVERLVESFESR